MAGEEAKAAARTDLSQLWAEVESLRDKANALFAQYENQDNVNDMSEYANGIGAHAYRIAAALSTIGEGLAQL